MTEERPAYGGHRALFLECRRGSTGPVLVAQIECTDSTVPKNEQGCKSGTCPSHPTPRDSQSRVETNPHTVRPARSSVHTRAIIDHPLHTHTGAESPSPLPKPSHRNPPAPPLPSPANPPRRGPKWTLLPPATTTPTEAATSRLRQRASPNLGKARAPPLAASTKASHSSKHPPEVRDKSGWRYWWVHNTRQGMEDFVRMVRERLNALGAPEKLISYGGRLEMVNSKGIAEDLPREEAQQGRGAGGGQASPGDQERQQQPRVDFWGGFYCSLGISPIMEKVKSVFGPGGSSTQDLFPDGPPRLSVYNDTVYSPPLTKRGEIELKQELLDALKHLQNSVQALGLQPVLIEDMQPLKHLQNSVPRKGAEVHRKPSSRRQQVIKYLLDTSLRQRGMKYLVDTEALLKDKDTLLKEKDALLKEKDTLLKEKDTLLKEKETQNSKLIDIFDQCSFQMKLLLAAGLDSKHVAPEFAKELESIVNCMDANAKKALNAGGHFFTLSGFLDKLKVPPRVDSWFGEAKHYGIAALYIAKLTDRAIRMYGSSHICFSAIGNESNRILNTEYTLDKLRSRNDSFGNVSFCLGAQMGGNQSVSQLMMKLKYLNNSIRFSLKSLGEVENPVANDGDAIAVPNEYTDVASVRISLDNLLETNLKYILEIPYPSFNGKCEVRAVYPYMVCAGGFDLIPNPGGVLLNRIPVPYLSAVFGVKNFGLGTQFQLQQGQLISSLGLSIKTDLFAAGFTRKNTGQYNATFCKELVDSSTTLAGRLSYYPPLVDGQVPLEPGVNPGFSVCVGIKHAFDPTLYCKARIGTDGAGFLVKKSSRSGMFSVKGAAHIDFAHPLTMDSP